MSDTPRTDEKVKIVRLTVGCVELPENHMVSADFARQLELELAEARAEIERKDKLIEQMREAIKFSLIADEVRQTRNVCASDINDACGTSKAKRIAALSAAERMKK